MCEWRAVNTLLNDQMAAGKESFLKHNTHVHSAQLTGLISWFQAPCSTSLKEAQSVFLVSMILEHKCWQLMPIRGRNLHAEDRMRKKNAMWKG